MQLVLGTYLAHSAFKSSIIQFSIICTQANVIPNPNPKPYIAATPTQTLKIVVWGHFYHTDIVKN